MNRRRHTQIFISVIALMMGSVIAFAHNGIEHVLGTVKSVTETSITVETVKHVTVTVMVDATTAFTHKAAKASMKDLKAGERVAINAKENGDKKLVALTVKWGSAAASAATHGHKM